MVKGANGASALGHDKRAEHMRSEKRAVRVTAFSFLITFLWIPAPASACEDLSPCAWTGPRPLRMAPWRGAWRSPDQSPWGAGSIAPLHNPDAAGLTVKAVHLETRGQAVAAEVTFLRYDGSRAVAKGAISPNVVTRLEFSEEHLASDLQAITSVRYLDAEGRSHTPRSLGTGMSADGRVFISATL
jgi:hypothetical protein